MVLETERLILRPWQIEDAGDLYEYARDPEVGPIAGWPPHQNIEESRQVIQNVFMVPECFALCLKENGRTVGTIQLKLKGHTDMTDREDECELGYWLGKPLWGQGLMPEAVQEILRHAFEDLGMCKVWCGYYDGNDRSKRVQEKCGFRYQWTTENVEVPLMQETRRGHVNCLTREEWITNRKRDAQIEQLLEKPWWIMDILPVQVPAGAQGQYSAVERYFLQPEQKSALYRKYAHILMKLNCYYDLEVSFDAGDSWQKNPDPEDFADKLTQLSGRGYLRVLIESSGTMMDLDTGDTWMTIYDPSPEILELLCKLAGSEGLFIWKPENHQDRGVDYGS